MADIRPFAALRPKKELAEKICQLPYDVMSSEEARHMAEGNPLSFLHVSKPEIDLPVGTDPYADEVYAKGAENLKRMIDSGSLYMDSKPKFYLYRQIMGEHSQVGLVAAASCADYQNSIIKKHEFTRPQKENDRVRHIESLSAQTGPVFLTYKSVAEMDTLFQEIIKKEPSVDFTADDDVRHTSWDIDDEEAIQKISDAFASIPRSDSQH